jgi:hypothetical protein
MKMLRYRAILSGIYFTNGNKVRIFSICTFNTRKNY